MPDSYVDRDFPPRVALLAPDPLAGRLIVDAIHEDGDWSAADRDAVEAEIDALSRWLGLPREG